MASLEKEIQQSSFQNEQMKANINVLYTAHWLHNRISSHLKPYGVTHEQFNVLRILRGKHPACMCQKDILQRMIAPSSNITLIIKKLVAKELVIVVQSAKDKREYEINISEAGLQKLQRIDEMLQTLQASVNVLTVEEATLLNQLLDKIRGA